MEETIELRELVTIMLKGKWVIAAFIAAAVLIAGIVSYFIIDPVYSSTATVSVNNGLVAGKPPTETDAYYNEVITPFAYTERVKSPQVLERAIEKSGLKNYTAGGVQSSLTVENTANTNLVSLTFKGKTAAESIKMLDSILITMQDSLLTEIQGRLHEDIEHYSAQAEAEKQNLETLLKQYRQQAESLNLPNSLLLDAVISYNNQYMINPDQDRLSGMTEISEQELISLNELSNEVKATAGVYRDYSNRERQLSAFSEIFRVDNKILTISAPVENDSPVSPKPMLNIAIAFVIGLMAGVGIVFLRHYWQNSNPEIQ